MDLTRYQTRHPRLLGQANKSSQPRNYSKLKNLLSFAIISALMVFVVNLNKKCSPAQKAVWAKAVQHVAQIRVMQSKVNKPVITKIKSATKDVINNAS